MRPILAFGGLHTIKCLNKTAIHADANISSILALYRKSKPTCFLIKNNPITGMCIRILFQNQPHLSCLSLITSIRK